MVCGRGVVGTGALTRLRACVVRPGGVTPLRACVLLTLFCRQGILIHSMESELMALNRETLVRP